ncbi:MAG: HAD family hydrolase [Chloroflexi bacterium]|nr:HAD family hydrolase [Chloroflexota bacterium]
MIRAVFFDMYNTIAHFYPPREELQAAACKEFGIQVTHEAILRGYALADDFLARENARMPLSKRTEEGQRDFFAEYERVLLEGADAPVTKEMAASIYARVRKFNYSLVLFDDVISTLGVLKGKGLVVGIISNIYRDLGNIYEKLGLLPYTDFVLTSLEAGSEKPHPPIFLLALKKAGVRPEETIHVGDQYNSDVIGARGVGIQPILIDREGLLGGINDCPKIQSLSEVLNFIN